MPVREVGDQVSEARRSTPYSAGGLASDAYRVQDTDRHASYQWLWGISDQTYHSRAVRRPGPQKGAVKFGYHMMSITRSERNAVESVF